MQLHRWCRHWLSIPSSSSTRSRVCAASSWEVSWRTLDRDLRRFTGAPIDPNVANTCKERLQLRDLRQGEQPNLRFQMFAVYGMTELSGIATWSHFECDKMEAVGVPLPGMLFKVIMHLGPSHSLCYPFEGYLRER